MAEERRAVLLRMRAGADECAIGDLVSIINRDQQRRRKRVA